MAFLNYSVPNFRLMVGTIDLTNWVAEISLGRPLPEISTPYSWDGQIKIVDSMTAGAIPVELDDARNLDTWFYGRNPVTLEINGTLICTLYIKKGGYRYQRRSRQEPAFGLLEVTDCLGLKLEESPPEDYKGLGLDSCAKPGMNFLISYSLDVNGLPIDDVSSVPGQWRVAPSKPDGAWIRWAQQMAGERGYWLYTKPNGSVAAQAYPFSTPTSSRFDRSDRGIEWPPERVYGLSELPLQVDVTASPYVCAGCGVNDEESVEREYDEDGRLVSVVYRNVVTRHADKLVETVDERDARGHVSPEGYPNDYTIVPTRFTTITTENDRQGRIVSRKSVSSTALAKAMPNEYPTNFTRIAGLESETETWSVARQGATFIGDRDDGAMRFHEYRKVGPVAYGSTYRRLTLEYKAEHWSNKRSPADVPREDEPVCPGFEYRIIHKIREGGEAEDVAGNAIAPPLRTVQSDTKQNQTPPSFETRAATDPASQVTVKGSATGSYPAQAYRSQPLKVQAQTLQTNGECAVLAEQILKMEAQVYFAENIKLPLPSEWVVNSSPFAIARVYDSMYVVCAEKIQITALGGGETYRCEFAFQGNLFNRINPPITEPNQSWVAPPPLFGPAIAITIAPGILSGMTSSAILSLSPAPAIAIVVPTTQRVLANSSATATFTPGDLPQQATTGGTYMILDLWPAFTPDSNSGSALLIPGLI